MKATYIDLALAHHAGLFDDPTCQVSLEEAARHLLRRKFPFGPSFESWAPKAFNLLPQTPSTRDVRPSPRPPGEEPQAHLNLNHSPPPQAGRPDQEARTFVLVSPLVGETIERGISASDCSPHLSFCIPSLSVMPQSCGAGAFDGHAWREARGVDQRLRSRSD